MTTIDTGTLISADSHVNEPRELWEANLPTKFREQALRGISPEDDGEWRVVLQGQTPMGAGGETEEERLAVLDPEFRLANMRIEGVAGECIFPTIGLYVWMLNDADVGKYSCRIYNEWIYDQLHSRSPRFCCAGIVPTWRIEDALEEVRFIADRGLGAVMLPTVPSNDLTRTEAVGWPNWNHSNWEPLWHAIAETGLPVVMHQGTGHDMVWYRGPGATIANVVATQAMAPRTASLLATSGVLERHPELHFVFVEYNAGWLAWTMETVDYYNVAFSKLPPLADGRPRFYPELLEPPSNYLRRQVHATFQDDETCLANIGRSGAESLMWGNDYPHPEGTSPDTPATVARLTATIGQHDADLVFHDNAARVFKFDPDVLATPV